MVGFHALKGVEEVNGVLVPQLLLEYTDYGRSDYTGLPFYLQK